MVSLPLALSIHSFVNKVGADAGFASIIGLAVLVLIYFAQARETATLRELAADAANRVKQLEGQLAQVIRAQQVAAQGGRSVARTVAANRAAASTGAAAIGPAEAGGVAVPSAQPALAVLGAPAGTAAPFLATATKLIPTPMPIGVARVVGVAGLAGAAKNGAGSASAPPVSAPASPPAAFPFDRDPGTPPPATVAGAGNGAGRVINPPGGGSWPPRVQLNSPSPASAGRPPSLPTLPTLPDDDPPAPWRRLGVILAVIVAVLLIAIGLISLTAGGSSKTPTKPTQTSNAPSATHKRKAKTLVVLPTHVTVAVLNGTATAHLAMGVAQKLTGAGYKLGPVTNASVQTHATTEVEYLTAAGRNDALAVAKSLGLPPSDVTAVNQSDQQVVCPPSGSCSANVIVTVGQDLSSGSASTAGGAAGPAGAGTATGASGGTAGAGPGTTASPTPTSGGTAPTTTLG